MNARSTLVLLAIATALGLYVWFGEIEGERRATEAEAEARKLLAFDEDAITGLEVPLEDGGSAKLVRAGAETWRLEAPIAFKADPEQAGDLLRTLASFESVAELDEVPDLEPFGLGAAARELVVHAGDASQRLRVGRPTPLGAEKYVANVDASGQTRVFTVATWRTDKLVRKLQTLRDARMVGIAAEDVSEFKIDVNGARVATLLRGETGEWAVTEPVVDVADADRVTRLLEDFDLARATGFVDDPGAPADYGLDPPEVVVALTAKDGRTERLSMGRSDGKSYLHVTGSAETERDRVIYEIVDRIRAGVPREVLTLRDRTVFKYDEAAVRRFVLRFPRDAAAEFAFTRDGTAWKPDGHERNVDPLRIEDLVFGLAEVHAETIPEKSMDRASLGLEPPSLRVEIYGEDAAELGWIEFGDPSPTAGLGTASSRTERLWQVNSDLGEDVPLGLQAFENQWILVEDDEPESAEVTD